MAECWSDLALKNPGSVVVEKWEAALKYIRPLNSLVHKGVRDSEFLKVIVDNICAVVPADIKLDDSHIQGRSRLCKVSGTGNRKVHSSMFPFVGTRCF